MQPKAAPDASASAHVPASIAWSSPRHRLRSCRWFDDPSDSSMTARRAAWQPPALKNQTPREEIYRSMAGQQATGACFEPATLYLNIVETRGAARCAVRSACVQPV